jgi:hypothetical protein
MYWCMLLIPILLVGDREKRFLASEQDSLKAMKRIYFGICVYNLQREKQLLLAGSYLIHARLVIADVTS